MNQDQPEYNEGWRAYRNGMEREDNPYTDHNGPIYETMATLWWAGWDDASLSIDGAFHE